VSRIAFFIFNSLRTPVILMTALAGEMARLHGFESGAIDYVAKPVRPRDVVRRIEHVLSAAHVSASAPTAQAESAPPEALPS